MHTKVVFLSVFTLLCVGLALPGGAVHAYKGGHHSDKWERKEEKMQQRFEKKQERLERMFARLHERLERRHVVRQERLRESRQRVCDRRRGVEERIGHSVPKPSFCRTSHDDSEVVAPPRLAFSVDPSNLEEGGDATLTWHTERADTCTASDGWTGDTATSGEMVVQPTETTTYTLSCENEGGSIQRSVTVEVTASAVPLPSVSLDADPASVESSATAILTWSTSNADVCAASGATDWSGMVATSGEEVVTVTATTTYKLSCGNESGTTTKQVMVAVVPTPVPEVVYDVVINEVAWMGTASSSNAEWIELYNRGSSPVDLAGWTLTATSGSPAITLSGTIGTGAYYLLERTDDTTVPFITADLIYTGGLRNSGEVLELRDGSNNLIDTVDGSDHWAIGGNNSTKETLQRSGDGWETATATPKAANW